MSMSVLIYNKKKKKHIEHPILLGTFVLDQLPVERDPSLPDKLQLGGLCQWLGFH